VNLSRRRFLQGAAGGGAAVAAGTIGVPALTGEDAEAKQLLPWKGPRQAGIVSARTAYGMVAAFDVVDDDLPQLLKDLTGRIAELTQGYPDRLDQLSNRALPPSDTGELGYHKRNDGRLTITVGLGASLFDKRFGLRGKGPPSLKRMPSFPVDNLDPERTHGDLLLLVQSDHAMITHHALRDIMRRTKGRLQGRWAQPCFQREDPKKVGRPKTAAVRGLLGFPDGSQNISPGVDDKLIWTGAEVPGWARGGTYLAVRLIRLKIERWDRLSRTAQEDSIGRHKITGGPLEGGSEQATPKLGPDTPHDAHIRLANPRKPGDERKRFLRRGFIFNNGFDGYGLLDSGSVFLAFSRDVQKQFEATKRNMIGQDLDEYAVAIGGGYFYCPPGIRGKGDYLARELVQA
jgi:deferrochelatase/peroxidase EfeB